MPKAFTVPRLNPGAYTVEAILAGLQEIHPQRRSPRADRLDISIALEIGAAEQSVTVSTETRCSTPNPPLSAPWWTPSASPTCRCPMAIPSC